MKPIEIEEKFGALLASIKAAAPDLYLSNVPKLVRAWEFQVALETLCDHLADQRGNRCPPSAYPDLIAMAHLLNVDERYWGVIQPG